MFERSPFWSAPPAWSEARIEAPAVSVRAVCGPAQLISGAVETWLLARAESALGPRDRCMQESYALRLAPDTKPRKSAAVVGDVMGKYHPHGDTAIYDAMVRLAQDWVLRAPLVEGQGNFGSIDGDPAAAFSDPNAATMDYALLALDDDGSACSDDGIEAFGESIE